MKVAIGRFLIAAFALVLVASHMLAEERSCDAVMAARIELGSLVGTGNPGEQQLVLPCGSFRAVARVRGQEILLAVSEPSGRPLYDVADPTAFALYAPLVARIL